MHFIKDFFDFIFHLDRDLPGFIAANGNMIYLVFFCVIFVETGFVIMPFLPGDSLLFIAGSFASIGQLNILALAGLLFLAAVIGDNSNYFIGKFFGHRAVKLKLFGKQLVRQKHLDKTHTYFEKYGARTIIIARFIPIVRTFTPFVAGVGTMSYGRFLLFDILGGAMWIGLMLSLGYFFGKTDFVVHHKMYITLGIIFVSVLPMIIEFFRLRAKSKNA